MIWQNLDSRKITGINEGGYTNKRADRGGETFAGIARNFWSQWQGWKYIDRYKEDYKKAKTKLSLASSANASARVATGPVRGLIVDFYRENFWNIHNLDQINDQQLANSIYDFGVNSGKGRRNGGKLFRMGTSVQNRCYHHEVPEY